MELGCFSHGARMFFPWNSDAFFMEWEFPSHLISSGFGVLIYRKFENKGIAGIDGLVVS